MSDKSRIPQSPIPNPQSPIPDSESPIPNPQSREGWEGWDAYAPFYDWENARTLGRRDVPFWRRIALEAHGQVLELGCGTGRVSIPIAKAGVEVVGVDRSAAMLGRLNHQVTKSPTRHLRIVRADIRALPFRPHQFAAVLAPYGVLQSLLSDRDLAATIRSVARVLAPGGRFGIDLVPDVPQWREYRDRAQLRGRTAAGAHLTLIESVRQNRARRVTTFEQRYLERRGRRVAEHRFTLKFRTVSVRHMASRLTDAGFSIDHLLGDYRGQPWDERADVWIILAKKR
jgi:ubiquinone/menaquinone biosynthesis C-methylase UbiE